MTDYFKPTKLIIVAHPDDEILWGGLNLLLGSQWHIVIATNKSNKKRVQEYIKTSQYIGAFQYDIFDIKDVYTEDAVFSDSLFFDTGKPFYKFLQKLSKEKWELVLTHNADGEYGHEHHKSIHKLVTKLFGGKNKNHGNLKYFKVSSQKLSNELLNLKQPVCQFYVSQDICRKVNKGNYKGMREDFRKHYQHETLYITLPENEQIPRLVHQIWIGSSIPTWRKYLFNSNREICKKNNIQYKLWTNKEFNEDNFPRTWEYIQTAIKVGWEIEQSKWAQIADLMRYEIIYKYGGMYFDSLFQLHDKFFKEFDKLTNGKGNHGKYSVLLCNEEPYKLTKGYISNGFFACTAKHYIMHNAISRQLLNKINFKSIYINRETGPYYFRKAIGDFNKGMYIFAPEKIYPFLMHETETREREVNKCLVLDHSKSNTNLSKASKSHNSHSLQIRKSKGNYKKNSKYLHIKDNQYLFIPCHEIYKNALVVYHSGLGGSWSY